jgi:hypothetical protein
MGIDPNTIAAGLIIATAHPIVVETFKFGLDLLKDQISTNKSAAYEKGLENFGQMILYLNEKMGYMSHQIDDIYERLEKALKDPNFHYLFTEASTTAFRFEDENKYKILVELLSDKIYFGAQENLIVDKAIEIMQYLDKYDFIQLQYIGLVLKHEIRCELNSYDQASFNQSYDSIFNQYYKFHKKFHSSYNLAANGLLMRSNRYSLEPKNALIELVKPINVKFTSESEEFPKTIFIEKTNKYFEESQIGKWLKEDIRNFGGFVFTPVGEIILGKIDQYINIVLLSGED